MLGWDIITKKIPGYNYAISPSGNVYNLHTGKKLKPGLAGNGYLTVALGRGNTKTIHSLLLETYVGPRPSNRHVCNHKDGNKLNNSLDNLEWVTYTENLKHAYKIGLNNCSGDSHHNTKVTNAQIRQMRTLRTNGISVNKIASLYNLSRCYAGQLLNGKVRCL